MNETDPRVKRTRKLLLDAFAALMAEKGFHAINVQDIAQRATVNRATFYAHFVDKYALLDQMISTWFRETLSRQIPLPSPPTRDNLRRLIVTVLDSLAEFHGHCKPSDRDLDRLIEARVQQELSDFLAGWIGQLPAAAGEHPVPREIAASLMSWAIFGAGIEWSRGPKTISVDQRAEQILALLTSGLGRAVEMPSGSRREPDRGTVREAVLPR